MASPNHLNTTHYSPLPRISTDSHINEITEEETLLPQVDNLSIAHVPQLPDWKITFDTAWISTWLLQIIALFFSTGTMIFQIARMAYSVSHQYQNGGHYRDGNRQYTAPLLAFASFDALVHALIILYFILSYHCGFKLVSTKRTSSVYSGGRSSKPTPEISQNCLVTIYLLEIFIIIGLITGTAIDLAFTRKIIMFHAVVQIFAWCTIIFRLISLINSLVQFASSSRTIYTVSAVTVRKGKPQPHRDISPGALAQRYKDVEEHGKQREDREIQPESRASGQA